MFWTGAGTRRSFSAAFELWVLSVTSVGSKSLGLYRHGRMLQRHMHACLQWQRKETIQTCQPGQAA